MKKENYILIESDYKPLKLKNLIKKINHKQVLINYDTGNSAGLGYDFNTEKKYFNYISYISEIKRFKDLTPQPVAPFGAKSVSDFTDATPAISK